MDIAHVARNEQQDWSLPMKLNLRHAIGALALAFTVAVLGDWS